MYTNILGIVGSLREHSFNKRLMEAFAAQMPDGAELTMASIGDLPLYSEDVEAAGLPESVTTLKQQIEAADAIIIATPEYNRAIPGVLKNALDWASRPYGKNSFTGKPTLIIGASVGTIATAVAQNELKRIMLYLDAHVVGQPEFYLGSAGEKFAENGPLTDEATKEHIDAAIAKLFATT